MIGSSLKMSSMSGPYKAEQALLFVPDGLLEAGEPIFWRNAVGALKKKMWTSLQAPKTKLLRKKVCQKMNPEKGATLFV